MASAISGSQATNAPGFRPAGMPESVLSTAPTFTNITASGSLLPQYAGLSGSIINSISGAIQSYVAGLAIGVPAFQGSLAAVVGNAGEGQLSSFSLILSYATGATGVSSITPPYSGRVVINDLSVVFS